MNGITLSKTGTHVHVCTCNVYLVAVYTCSHASADECFLDKWDTNSVFCKDMQRFIVCE